MLCSDMRVRLHREPHNSSSISRSFPVSLRGRQEEGRKDQMDGSPSEEMRCELRSCVDDGVQTKTSDYDASADDECFGSLVAILLPTSTFSQHYWWEGVVTGMDGCSR